MENKSLILLVEDNEELNASNSRALRLRGYTVLTAKTIAEARELLWEKEPDIILLDVMLPDGDGFHFCKEIRRYTTAHILFLTAKTEHEDLVQGLAGGGDDYITKPFHPEELLLRVDAAARRRMMNKAAPHTITKGALTLDVVSSSAFIDGIDLLLTPREFSLLLLLVQNEGKIMSAADIYNKVWNQPLSGDKNALRTIISKLRQKLPSTGYTIAVMRGQGYVFRRK